MSGAIKMVTMRSFTLSIVRVAIMPGTAQAKDDISGKKDLPLRPIVDIILSTTNAARDM